MGQNNTCNRNPLVIVLVIIAIVVLFILLAATASSDRHNHHGDGKKKYMNKISQHLTSERHRVTQDDFKSIGHYIHTRLDDKHPELNDTLDEIIDKAHLKMAINLTGDNEENTAIVHYLLNERYKKHTNPNYVGDNIDHCQEIAKYIPCDDPTLRQIIISQLDKDCQKLQTVNSVSVIDRISHLDGYGSNIVFYSAACHYY